YTGATTIRVNTLTLIDSGALSGTSSVNVNYATLALDNSGLNPIGNVNPSRLPAAAPLNLAGGTFTFAAGGSGDYSQAINTVNVNQGHSTVTVTNAPAGSTGAVNIGNFVVAPDATVNVNNAGFFNAAPGLGISNLYLTSV